MGIFYFRLKQSELRLTITFVLPSCYLDVVSIFISLLLLASLDEAVYYYSEMLIQDLC